jgi:hypothetical protein
VKGKIKIDNLTDVVRIVRSGRFFRSQLERNPYRAEFMHRLYGVDFYELAGKVRSVDGLVKNLNILFRKKDAREEVTKELVRDFRLLFREEERVEREVGEEYASVFNEGYSDFERILSRAAEVFLISGERGTDDYLRKSGVDVRLVNANVEFLKRAFDDYFGTSKKIWTSDLEGDVFDFVKREGAVVRRQVRYNEEFDTLRNFVCDIVVLGPKKDYWVEVDGIGDSWIENRVETFPIKRRIVEDGGQKFLRIEVGDDYESVLSEPIRLSKKYGDRLRGRVVRVVRERIAIASERCGIRKVGWKQEVVGNRKKSYFSRRGGANRFMVGKIRARNL